MRLELNVLLIGLSAAAVVRCISLRHYFIERAVLLVAHGIEQHLLHSCGYTLVRERGCVEDRGKDRAIGFILSPLKAIQLVQRTSSTSPERLSVKRIMPYSLLNIRVFGTGRKLEFHCTEKEQRSTITVSYAERPRSSLIPSIYSFYSEYWGV